MGNKTQRPSHDQNSKEKTEILTSIKHPKLSKAKLVNHTNDHQSEYSYLQVSQPVPSQQIYQKWKIGITKYQVKPQQLETILLPKELHFQEKSICGSSGIIKSQYVVVPFVLSQQIENRRAIKQPFLQQQLWYLLYVLNLSGKTAHSRELIIGDVRPQNVLMSSDGQICVCCLQSFLEQQKNYYKSLTTKTKTYLAPQQMQDLQHHKSQPTQNQQLSQNFSIGLSILSALMLKDYLQLYNLNDFKFNQSQLNQDINEMRNNSNYSPFLKQLIQGLLQKNQKNRIKCQQIIKVLGNYEQNIVNLQQFQIQFDSIPQQIKERLNIIAGMSVSSARSQSSNGDYRKVINSNDFNKNSRIQYARSPRNLSFVNQNLNYPIYQDINYPKVYQKQLKNDQPIRTTETHYLMRPPSNISNNSKQMPVLMTKNIGPQSLVLSQSIPLRPVFNQPNIIYQQPNLISKPNNLTIPQSSFYGSSFISSPDVQNYQSNIGSFIPNQYQVITNRNLQASKANKQRIIFEDQKIGVQRLQPTIVSSQSPKFSHGAPIYQNIVNQRTIIANGPITHQVQSNISRPIQYQIVQPMTRLTQISRQATSLYPTHQQRYLTAETFKVQKNARNSNISSNIEPVKIEKYDKSKDKIFQSYEEIMKNIDNRLRDSKLQFPDDV